jgi:hypothetical protein
VASEAHYGVSGIDFDAVRKSTKSLTGFPEAASSARLGEKSYDGGLQLFATFSNL